MDYYLLPSPPMTLKITKELRDKAAQNIGLYDENILFASGEKRLSAYKYSKNDTSFRVYLNNKLTSISYVLDDAVFDFNNIK